MNSTAGSAIDGVRVIALKVIPNERGRLMEIQRRDDVHFLGFGQVYLTATLPGVIKAWYRHREQFDQLAVARGLLKLALYDARADSPTRGAVQVIHLGEAAPQLVQVPPGIWHGFQAMGATEALALHLNTEPFRFDAPDEERLPTHSDVVPYRW